MDINILRGLITVTVFLAFIVIWVWAYSRHAKSGFEESAMLPFSDEPEQASKEKGE
jgi:cytochrome c oxidase cbb3-type subunit 4